MRIFLLLLVCLLGACRPARGPQWSVFELTGTKEERVKIMMAMITKRTPLPGPLLDASFLEEKIGDGVLGPSDFREFYVLTVAPDDVPAWTKLIASLKTPELRPEYAEPKQRPDWWLDPGSFPALKLVSPQKITGRIHGWAGIAPAEGKIYIYSFTM